MDTKDCKYRVGDTFHLPLDELASDVGENMREVHDSGLRELAESMGPTGLGQLLPILVVWRDGRFHVAAGFRRGLAMRAYREELGFTEILARRIRLEDADVARLVENLEREIPSTFETCRYLYELREGLRGAAISVADLAAATGKSVRHIDNLIRFYRVLPDGLRKAWAADRDQRFTFAILRELAVAAQSGDDAAVQAIVERTLKVSSPPAAVGGSHRHGVIRRLGHASTTKLQLRLEAAGIDRLHSDDRAELVYDLLRAINGEGEPKRAQAIVDLLLFDLGMTVLPERSKGELR